MSGGLVRAHPAATAALTRWTPEQVDLIKQQVCPGATDEELAFFAQVCAHRDLDPFAAEITGIMRWNGKTRREELKIQVTVEGLRTIAMRTGLYDSQDEPLWCDRDGTWRDIWPHTDRPPFAAKVTVWRKDSRRPFTGKAHYHEFVQLDKDKRPTPMWAKMPANQLAKCAERQALIRAFKAEMQAAGIDVTDLGLPSRISMEARAAGLDDDGRHQLIADVTAGRSTSSRDLTADEALAVRSELAALRPDGPDDQDEDDDDVEDADEVAGTDTDTDEPGGAPDRDDVPPADPAAQVAEHHGLKQVHQPGPEGTTALWVDLKSGQVMPSDELERRQLTARIYRDAKTLTPEQRADLEQYQRDCRIDPGQPPSTYTVEQLHLLDAWFDNLLGEPF